MASNYLPPITNTYSTITQQWSGNYSSNIDDFFEYNTDEAHIRFNFNPSNGFLIVSIGAYGEGALENGPVLNFSAKLQTSQSNSNICCLSK